MDLIYLLSYSYRYIYIYVYVYMYCYWYVLSIHAYIHTCMQTYIHSFISSIHTYIHTYVQNIWEPFPGPCKGFYLARPPGFQHETAPRFFFWVRESNFYLAEGMANIYLDEVAQPVFFLEIQSFWIGSGRQRNQVLYCNQVELNPAARFKVWGRFAKEVSRKLCKVPRKQWPEREGVNGSR